MKKQINYFVLLFYLLAQPLYSCYEATIIKPTPFLGNDGEIVKLSDGTLWEVKFTWNYLYLYYPEVIICPESNKLYTDRNKYPINVYPIGRITPEQSEIHSQDASNKTPPTMQQQTQQQSSTVQTPVETEQNNNTYEDTSQYSISN